MSEKQAQMEAVYTHMWASHEGGPFAPLDESLHPRPHSMLYEVAATCGVDASSLVLVSAVAEATIAVRWPSALAARSSAWTWPSSTSSRDEPELCKRA